MPRYARTGLLVVLLLLVGMGAWWLLQSDAPYPQSQPLGVLEDTTAIRWSDDGLAVIEAEGRLDALAGLGYAHGVSRGWTVALWRQTARGRLSRWFGTDVLPLDRHARRLGLAEQAKRAYDQLPAADKRALRAYTRGLNAALQSEHVRGQESFVLLEVTPSPWKPWHTLAVERLVAWLATPPLQPPAHAPSAVTEFRETDRQFRRWLHLHGWSRSVAWAARSAPPNEPAQTVLFQRHVLGATAPPILQEVMLDRPGAPRLAGTTLPGMPLVPTGSRGERAWASLLRGQSELNRIPYDSTEVRRWHERLTPSNGDEQLLEVERLNGALLLGRTDEPDSLDEAASRPKTRADTTLSPPPERAWVLRWPGLSADSDLPAWLRRAGLSVRRDTASFGLFAADGLQVSAEGQWRVLGAPSVVVRDSTRRVAVGQTRWAQHQAQGLRAHHRPGASLDAQRWTASDSSTWAATLLPHFQPALDRLSTTHPQFRNAATYLRNWDYTYDASSIGATLFDQWMRAYRAELGHVPQSADTAAYFGTYRQHRSLLRALDSLQHRFGPDIRQWRWERAVPDRRFFPVWSADSLVATNLQELSTTQYAPLDRSGRGHPSALAGGPSLVASPPTAPAPTTWEGWMSPSDSTLTVRRHHFDPAATFARSRMRRQPPSPLRLTPDSTTHTTTLVPRPE